VRPTLDNPMTWSVPLLRVFGIAVRVHVLFVVMIAIFLVKSALGASSDMFAASVGLMAILLAALFLIVLLHEFGHCLACRWVRGQADEILMWPLGGLAYCMPPHHWRAHLVTVVGGPAVNVIIFVLLAPIVWIVSGQWWGTAVPNPLTGPPPLQEAAVGSWYVMYALMSVNWMNIILLLFNLLPIFPLDGGRFVQAALWPRVGYGRSMRLAVYTGYVGAIGLFIFGAVVGEWLLIGIAFFGGITCWHTLKQLQWTASVMGGEENDVFAAAQWSESEITADAEPEAPAPGRGARRAERQERDREAESSEVDAILAKIAQQGLDSLTDRERRLLQRATERRRES